MSRDAGTTARKRHDAGLTSVLLVSHVGMNLAIFRRALIRRLLAEGVHVVCALPEDRPDSGDPHVQTLLDLGTRVERYPLSRGSLNPLGMRRAARALRRIVERVDPDVVHSFTHQPNILARLAAGRRRPVINSITGLGSMFLGSGPGGALKRGVMRQAYRLTAPLCRCVVFQNPDDRDDFARWDMLGRARAELVRGTGVNTSRFSPRAVSREQARALRRGLGIPGDAVVATLAGRLLRDKGVGEFLEAADMLADRHPEAVFLLVGEGDPGNPSDLGERVAEAVRNRPNVRAPGWVDDMAVVWAASDVAVLPSYREGLPVTMQEALACGLPAVVTDVPGCREVVRDGENGYLVDKGDAKALAEALAPLLADADLRAAMGRKGRARAEEEFDSAVLAGQQVDLYRELLAGTSAERPPRFPLWKRALDLALVLLAAPLWLPLLALTALLVRLRLGSPVLFSQTRPGLGGRPFTLRKFRTMTDERGPDGELLPDDERLPAFGRLLRSTSLDELPELFNVLAGDMSLVGPRPLLMEYLPLYSPWQARRHEAPPGITGWAQINGRNALDWPDVFRHDVWYVDHMSPATDLRILWRTVLAVLARRGVSEPGRATRSRFKG